MQINGYRVELREIEVTVEAIAGVERAFAMLSDDRILLFAQTASADVDKATIRAALSPETACLYGAGQHLPLG